MTDTPKKSGTFVELVTDSLVVSKRNGVEINRATTFSEGFAADNNPSPRSTSVSMIVGAAVVSPSLTGAEIMEAHNKAISPENVISESSRTR